MTTRPKAEVARELADLHRRLEELMGELEPVAEKADEREEWWRRAEREYKAHKAKDPQRRGLGYWLKVWHPDRASAVATWFSPHWAAFKAFFKALPDMRGGE